MPLGHVRDHLYAAEGADSPEEFVEVWNSIHPNKGFEEGQLVWVHWFENPYQRCTKEE
jgi:hypothetical protein